MRNDLRARAVAFRLAMSLARRGERERSEVSALQEWRSDANSTARAACVCALWWYVCARSDRAGEDCER